ncbi:MAG: DUF4942 domain-containing protein [Pseudomonadota bacterium]
MFDETSETAVAFRKTIAETCRERNAALSAYRAAAEALDAAYDLSKEAAALALRASGGCEYDGTDHSRRDHFAKLHRDGFDPARSMEAARKALDARVWTHLTDFAGIDRLMDAEAKEAFRSDLLSDVPEITEDTVRATFQRLHAEAGMIWKRGAANVFSSLDRRFRSHNGFKIGSRIILDRLFNDSGFMEWGRQRDRLIDIERIFYVLDGREGCYSIVDRLHRERSGFQPHQSEHVSDYMKVRVFKNGNAHLWFTRDDLVRKANLTLAEYYGDVIPDGMDERAAKDVFRDVKLTPAKRFGFFPSPPEVVTELFRSLHIEEGASVLEPSAGTGNLARRAVERGGIVDCIEIQPHLADELTAEGVYRSVTCADFHSFTPDRLYDVIVMNPPFDRGRDIDHIMRAWSFLKPGGQLVSVLHAGIEFSETMKAVAFRKFAEAHKTCRWGRGAFEDLPPASFASVGTYVNAVLVRLSKPNEAG